MLDINIAAALLDVKLDELVFFDEPDTFNDNQLSGYLCRRSDHRYGTLVIGSVGGIETDPQVIYTTPKLHYPFGRTPDEERRYHWPENIQAVEVYEKLDGTNICIYGYADSHGERFVTFKTRLTPVVRGNRFGDFAKLWSEVLGQHQALRCPSAVLTGEFSLSFELYGHRNVHTIVYPVPLVCRLLFGIDQQLAAGGGGIVSPASLELGPLAEFALQPLKIFTGSTDLTKWYESMRADANEQNKALDGGDRFEGTEGFVFYVCSLNHWIQFKCKPENIEALHWLSDFIPLNTIIATTWAALEETENLDTQIITRLLREEFTEVQCLTSTQRIETAIETVQARVIWRLRVGEAFAATGLNWETDGKPAVMRALSSWFAGSQMKEVFNGLRELGIHNE